MKRSFLTDLGIDSDAVDKIMKEHGATVNSLKDELDKVDEYKQQIEDLNGQIQDRDKQLEELSEKAKDNEELTKEIDTLKEQNKQTAKEYQEKLEQQTFEYKLDKALSEVKARNPKAVKALLDMENIKLDGDNLLGLDDQLKALQDSDAYLFDDGKPSGRNPHPPSDPQPKGITKEQFESMSYLEKMELYNSDLETYQKLSKGE